MNLNETTLKQICPRLSTTRATEIAAILLQKATKYNILDKDIFEEFLANVAHESGEFTIKSENLNYTTATVLIRTWPSRFNASNAPLFLRNPKLLANTVYNGRMGNRAGSNDGFNFRGGGYAQITGRDAYTLYFNYIKNKVAAKSIEELAALVHTTEELAIDSAFWFFCEFKNFEQLAIQDNFRELVRRWNGGFIGMPDREKYYQRCKQFL